MCWSTPPSPALSSSLNKDAFAFASIEKRADLGCGRLRQVSQASHMIESDKKIKIYSNIQRPCP
jgi:hypothetical protein